MKNLHFRSPKEADGDLSKVKSARHPAFETGLGSFARWQIAFLAVCIILATVSGAWAGPQLAGSDGLGDPMFPTMGNGGYDAKHYRIDLSIDIKGNRIDGTTRMDAVATHALKRFNLDFFGLDIESVRIGEEDVEYEQMGSELVVIPTDPFDEGESFSVTVTYRGSPKRTTDQPEVGVGGGWVNTGKEIFVVWSPKCSATWFPNNEHTLDKATVTMRATVPTPYVVTGSGRLVSTIEKDDATTYVWETREPIFTGALGLCVGKYHSDTVELARGMVMHNYGRGASLDRFEIAGEIIEFFEGYFGPFPYETLGFTYIEDLPVAGFSADMRVLMSTLSVRTIAHEIAHQWFGGSVSPVAAKDMWLVEGFATYATMMWVEHSSNRALNRQAANLYGRLGSRTTTIGDPEPQQLFSMPTYNRGALTLYAIRVEVGDDAFDKIVREYTTRYQYSAASTEDFVQLCEEVSERDLSALFDQWLYDTVVPKFPE